MKFVSNGMTLLGACILLAALFPLRRMISQLPEGNARRQWRILQAMILLFIAGYLGYAVTRWDAGDTPQDFFAPVIFLLGAVFVFLVNTLSLRTTIDVRRFAALEVESVTDPLMGIRNRRYLDRRLGEEVERARRYGLPLSVLLLDIDHFKQINDEFGHPAGDLVLSALGKLISGAVRATDVVARYGGEEIVVLATCTPDPPVPVLAERLRRAVEETVLVAPCDLTGGREIRVTASIGVASIGMDTPTAKALVAKADKALYRAKHEGRNRVVLIERDCPG